MRSGRAPAPSVCSTRDTDRRPHRVASPAPGWRASRNAGANPLRHSRCSAVSTAASALSWPAPIRPVKTVAPARSPAVVCVRTHPAILVSRIHEKPARGAGPTRQSYSSENYRRNESLGSGGLPQFFDPSSDHNHGNHHRLRLGIQASRISRTRSVAPSPPPPTIPARKSRTVVPLRAYNN
jgi:hypothetical protein